MMVWPWELTMDLTRDRAMRPVCWAMMEDWAISRAAVPPMWKVRMVSWVPGSPMDWAAMMPTVSPTLTRWPRARSRP